MTTIQVTLPDQLAQEAERAGLLSSQSLEELLRRQLKAKAAGELIALMDKLDPRGMRITCLLRRWPKRFGRCGRRSGPGRGT